LEIWLSLGTPELREPGEKARGRQVADGLKAIVKTNVGNVGRAVAANHQQPFLMVKTKGEMKNSMTDGG
jgi:hypothetical protein